MSAGARRVLLTSMLSGLAITIAVPLVELWLDCHPPRVPRAEACVWGHSLLPISLTVGVVLGLGLGLLIFGVRRALSTRP